ncbi:hypothetical protein YC2023_033040 [Brassica napus]
MCDREGKQDKITIRIASRGIGPRRPDQSPKGKGRVNSLTRRQLGGSHVISTWAPSIMRSFTDLSTDVKERNKDQLRNSKTVQLFVRFDTCQSDMWVPSMICCIMKNLLPIQPPHYGRIGGDFGRWESLTAYVENYGDDVEETETAAESERRWRSGRGYRGGGEGQSGEEAHGLDDFKEFLVGRFFATDRFPSERHNLKSGNLRNVRRNICVQVRRTICVELHVVYM